MLCANCTAKSANASGAANPPTACAPALKPNMPHQPQPLKHAVPVCRHLRPQSGGTLPAPQRRRHAGRAEKIISNGTSAGGALSVLLGAGVTDGDDRKLFEIMGAADARDDIYAVSAYCPISILEHADAAYEWEFNGVNDYEKMDITMLDYKVERKLVKGTLDTAEQRVSDELKAQFPAYVNSLGLKNARGEALTLNDDGSGSFRDYVAAYIAAAAEAELQKGADPAALQAENPWLAIDGNFAGNYVKKWISPPTPKPSAGRKSRPPSTRLTSPAAKTSSLATPTRTRATSPPTAPKTARLKARAAPVRWR